MANHASLSLEKKKSSEIQTTRVSLVKRQWGWEAKHKESKSISSDDPAGMLLESLGDKKQGIVTAALIWW